MAKKNICVDIQPEVVERQAWINELDQKEKAGMVTKEYILSKFVECVEGVGVFEGIKPTQVIRGLERLGDHLKMFIQHKKVDIDFRGLLREAPIHHLEKIVEAEVLEEAEIPALPPSRSGRLQTTTRGVSDGNHTTSEVVR